MKKTGMLVLVLFAVLSAVPLGVYYLSPSMDVSAPDAVSLIPSDQPPSEQLPSEEPTSAQEEILVCMATSGSVVGMTVQDYVIGVVAAEMPALYEAEALKAQAAASMNLARLALEKGTSDRLNGGHISSSSAVDQAYLTVEQMQKKWGSDFETYYDRIAEAVQAVSGYEIVYEDELCQTCFHAVSAGRTEDSENVWLTATPYLTAVDSSFDSTADNFTVSVQLYADDFAQALKEYGFEPTQTARLWLGESKYSESGTLLSLEVGNITVTGSQLREAFGLRSAAVTVTYEDGEFILTTNGYGHGVGMSQYGAQQLALQGKTWQEIIQYYYTGAEIAAR